MALFTSFFESSTLCSDIKLLLFLIYEIINVSIINRQNKLKTVTIHLTFNKLLQYSNILTHKFYTII